MIAAGLLAACDGDNSNSSAPPGSPQNPLVADAAADRANEAAPRDSKSPAGAGDAKQGSERRPGYKDLVDRQSRRPRGRFTPCNLVSKAQARAIVGAPIEDPLEAPQGPTCIYRAETKKSFITLAVQSVNFKKLRPQIRQPRRIKVSKRTAYCGQFGQAMLYMPLSRGRVLSIAGSCGVAQKFAATAVQRLKG